MTSQDIEPTTAGAASGPAGGTTPRRRRPRTRTVVGAAVAVAVLAGAGTTVALLDRSGSHSGTGGTGTGTTAAGGTGSSVPGSATAVGQQSSSVSAAVAGVGAGGSVPWQSPLRVTATGGTLTGVSGADPAGQPVAGAVGPDGVWQATTPLVPASSYALQASVLDASGQTRTVPVSATTTPATTTFTGSVAPGDGAVVGVGQAVSLHLSTPVTDRAARASVERSLTVTTVPAVEGAWRWVSSTDLRYRAAAFWQPGTTITVTAALGHAQAKPGVWGAATRTSTFTVGDAITSVVDDAAHTMTVSRNGQVLRVLPASMGKPRYDTRTGVFVVLEKSADKIMDSSTVDLPPGTPPYKTAVKDAVRLTNSGTFTHGAPWSVRSQGKANVSHGCVNLSPADAHWFFTLVRRGDVVQVINGPVGPVLTDAGSQDWNISFDQWKAGSALSS